MTPPSTAARRPNLPDALEGGYEWTAVLYQPGTDGWQLVGTTGDRAHAESEAQAWIKTGLHDGERIALACRVVPRWTVIG